MSNPFVERLLGPKAKGLKSSKSAVKKPAEKTLAPNADQAASTKVPGREPEKTTTGTVLSDAINASAHASQTDTSSAVSAAAPLNEPIDFGIDEIEFELGLTSDADAMAPPSIQNAADQSKVTAADKPAKSKAVSADALKTAETVVAAASDKISASDKGKAPKVTSTKAEKVTDTNMPKGAEKAEPAEGKSGKEQVKGQDDKQQVRLHAVEQENRGGDHEKTTTKPAAMPPSEKKMVSSNADKHNERQSDGQKTDVKAAKEATVSKLKKADDPTTAGGEATGAGQTAAKDKPKSMPARKPSKAAELIAAKKAEMAKVGGSPNAARKPTETVQSPKPEKPAKKVSELTPEEILAMVEEAGSLLTGPGGAYERRPEQRELMALFENGLFLVSKSHMDDPHVVSFAGLLRRKGMTINLIPCDIALLTKCYESGGDNENQVMKADDEATSMQREIVRFIAECARLKASDAHVVVSHGSAIVRLRIDGVLKDFVEWRAAYGSDFCAAAFAMADASDASYQPYEYQAARISDTSVRLPGGVQALRLQFNPLSYGGRHMVARFLYRTQGIVGDVDTLGYAEKQVTSIKRMRAVPMGINIVAGPTGSGKSTTLQRILSTLMIERKNEIATFTVEDPPEYVIEGAQQMPVTNANTAEERKEKFNAAIRASLRSDPDVIMIGEIRDEESAKLAFEAAMTGHQVWATLHAVDCLTIISRLRDIGVDEFKLYDPAVFTGLVGQRLTRALCDDCKVPFMTAREKGEVDDELWERTLEVYNRDLEGIYTEGPGCPKCSGTGVTGRSVVAEVLLPDDGLMELMKQEKKVAARQHWVQNLNGITMMGHGILKIKAGVCSPYEIERMLGPLELDQARVSKVAAE
ncbi:MAG: hypothetical protein CL558_12240 [Alphaproteobacteria bacterium]|nr:hypothetical protein [Alphaproteobacteria bacterium]MAS46283.1 hypothetical protein [Alphaproteobacteria bacterium]MAX95531.1 hypothetical protein [Alphaproteobacteria bacterium]MBN54330.1 hypothetical protein [Alphaproteobacteria bacterium]OUT42105.1 MAG: hypothetical protein CBB62_07340 [Micavibrio sp. TMED2]|tara:strand:- start:18388 stop:20988 length:2601 start_codon:yes stop_codon:yes gene_type:complete